MLVNLKVAIMLIMPILCQLCFMLRPCYYAKSYAGIMRSPQVVGNWCKFLRLVMGILSYCTAHRVYVQIAETEVHSRTVVGLNTLKY